MKTGAEPSSAPSRPPLSVRNVVFWAGAAATLIWSTVFYTWFSIAESGSPNWFLMVTVGGPLVAYFLAWTVLRLWPERAISIVFYITSLAFVYAPSIAMLYLPGLLGLIIGTPVRRHRQTARNR